MEFIYEAIDNGSEDVINAWCPTFCIGIRAINWKVFESKFQAKVLKMAGIGQAGAARIAAAQIAMAASIVAAENKQFSGSLQHSFLELCQDANAEIRKFILSNLRLLLEKLSAEDIDKIFLSEILGYLNDQNDTFRHLMMELIMEFHQCFAIKNLELDFAPVFIKEFEQECKEPENWLLNHCASIVHFFNKRGWLKEDSISLLNTFFDVFSLL